MARLPCLNRNPMRFLLALFLAACTSFAQAQLPQPPEIAARQYLLIDLNSHQVLAEREVQLDRLRVYLDHLDERLYGFVMLFIE